MKKVIIQSLRGNINRTVLGLVGVVMVSSIIGIGARVYADDVTDVVDTVNLTIPVSCTFGSGGGTYNDTMAGGTVKEITANAITTSCNDTAGYAIYAIGFSNNKYTSDTTGNNNDMITSLGSSHNITTSSNNTYGSNWKMKLTSPVDAVVESAFNNTYTTIPSTYAKVASYTTNTTGGSITPKYQITTGSSQPAGTYTGKVKYTLVHPSTAPAPVACNPDATTIGDAVCLQDFAGANHDAIVASMTAGTQYTKKDKRDGKTYTIAKLADNNVWMTQNLDLDLDSSKTYTNEDTDLGWNGTSYTTASWSPERSTYATGTTTWGLYNSTTGDHDGIYHPESYDPGNLYWNSTLSDFDDWNTYYSSCTFDNDTWLYSNCNESLNPLSTYTSSTGTTQFHLGNYYNWSAAIASNDSSSYGAYDSGTDSYINTQTNQSICPTGWTLPIGSYYESPAVAPNKSFQHLIEQYGWNDSDLALGSNKKIWESPIYLGLSGNWFGMLGSVGDYVSPWSSTASNAESAYFLVAGSVGYVGPGEYDGRSSGFVVRCVAR